MSPHSYAENADVADYSGGFIFHGFGFTPGPKSVHVSYVLSEGQTALITREGTVIETTMDDAEVQVMLGYYERIKNQLYGSDE